MCLGGFTQFTLQLTHPAPEPGQLLQLRGSGGCGRLLAGRSRCMCCLVGCGCGSSSSGSSSLCFGMRRLSLCCCHLVLCGCYSCLGLLQLRLQLIHLVLQPARLLRHLLQLPLKHITLVTQSSQCSGVGSATATTTSWLLRCGLLWWGLLRWDNGTQLVVLRGVLLHLLQQLQKQARVTLHQPQQCQLYGLQPVGTGLDGAQGPLREEAPVRGRRCCQALLPVPSLEQPGGRGALHTDRCKHGGIAVQVSHACADVDAVSWARGL
mmetsp:Transcript_33487/g.74096  ORF Transcript_33487/g.74096 Transcript_33487/m.74096 type:complete len:265 (-) Transcript_33487:932-1726(-)